MYTLHFAFTISYLAKDETIYSNQNDKHMSKKSFDFLMSDTRNTV